MALFATLAGGVSGLASAALLAIVNRAVHTPDEGLFGILAAFAGLCFVSLAGDLVGNIGNNLVAQRIIAKLRKEQSSGSRRNSCMRCVFSLSHGRSIPCSSS